MKALARIPARPGAQERIGMLRRSELAAYESLLEKLGEGVVLVTGAGDGRRALGAGLAAASAAGGVSTALLECDLAEPMLAAGLGLSPRPGLAEYLAGAARPPELLQPLVLAGPATGEAGGPLVCVVAGSGAGLSRAGIDSGAFRHAVAKLAHGYRRVVLQGPPLGDDSGALRAAAAEAAVAVACVGPELADGRSGRRLRRAVSRLPSPRSGLVVYG